MSPFLELWNFKLITLAGINLVLGPTLLALLILIFAARLSRLVVSIMSSRLIEPFVADKAAQNTYQTFAFYGALAAVVTLAMTVAGIPLTVFTVVGGALAIGVGFGSQNIVNNFISGMILLVEKPIKVGDIVELEGMMGTIQSIGTRSTKLKTVEDRIFIIPNSFFLEKAVLNSTFQTSVVRTAVEVGVAYGSNVRQVENICLDILLNTEGVKQEPMPLILFDNFADSALTFRLVFWADVATENLALLRSTVRFKINDRFEELGIEIAFPQRDMNLKVNKPLEVRMLS